MPRLYWWTVGFNNKERRDRLVALGLGTAVNQNQRRREAAADRSR